MPLQYWSVYSTDVRTSIHVMSSVVVSVVVDITYSKLYE